ncbi:MAG: molybdopterin-guanine dinucleotide biosynthesis protein B [Candidatus Aminicenantes bacterium]|nr:molybdopterin-guanine dinucleotide biosynthesis protein B [Candidatus Aminicenantes bacterium]
MKVVAIVGPSESGKTKLIESLIRYFRQQGLECGVLKLAEEEIELDEKGKDSWRFGQAGASQVGVLTKEKFFFLKNFKDQYSWLRIITDYFLGVDLLLIEGGKKVSDFKKIFLAKNSEDLKSVEFIENLIAVVSDEKFNSTLPHFYPYQIKELAKFLLENLSPMDPLIQIKVDGQIIPLNPFVESMIKELVQAMIRPLKNIPANPRLISILLKK